MMVSNANNNKLFLPSIALGLSCGVGFVAAQELWRRRKSNHLLWRRISNVEQLLVVPWALVGIGSGDTRGFYPIALWWFLKEMLMIISNDDDDDDKEDKGNGGTSRGNVERSTTDHQQHATVKVTPRASNAIRTIPEFNHDASVLHPPPLPPYIDPKSSSLPPPPPPQRQLEILVHNISHTDLVLSIDPQDIKDNNEEGEYCLCRPRFSAFDLFTKRVLSALSHEPETIAFPRYERSGVDYRIVQTPKPSRQKLIPTGFRLAKNNNKSLQVSSEELQSLRFRRKDAHRLVQQHDNKTFSLDAIFFPLLAAVLPRWHQQIASKYNTTSSSYNSSSNASNINNNIHKVLILVSGVGTPRNYTHSIHGNSTRACSQLMQRFVKLQYPDVTVVLLHSATNLFRFDDNIAFSQKELRPCIDAYRDTHARGMPYPTTTSSDEWLLNANSSTEVAPFNPDWKQSFHLSLSYADGSSARTHAIQVALRPYRPSSYFFWQLKSFWHDLKVVDDDIEYHSFQEMETVPAIEVTSVVDQDTKAVIAEMKAFRQEFCQQLEQRNDVLQFWLRKTKKPVLAVLLVRIPGRSKQPLLYRGTNMEVSMPTGSLCAERNVIGTALASNPGLKREDLKMVAVLAVPLEEEKTDSNNMSTGMVRNMSYSSIVMQDDDGTDDWILPPPDDNLAQELTERTANLRVPSSPNSSRHNIGLDLLPPLNNDSSVPGTPVRRVMLYGKTSDGTRTSISKGNRTQKRTVLIHSHKDLNPLKPCGACNEWLKKLAECNPNFSVVTFTDADCSGVYCTPCQE